MNALENRIRDLEERLAKALEETDRLRSENEQLCQEKNRLKIRVEELEEQLKTNSKNSSKPPSQDPYRKSRSRKKSERKQGGQPGSKGAFRKRFSKECVTEVVEINPTSCPCCKGKAFDPSPLRTEIRQVADLPDIKLSVTEYHINTCKCAQCGENAKGEVPIEAKGSFGPKVMGFLTLLSGEYGLSKRKIANLLGHLNLKISLGTICKLHHIAGEILAEAYERIKEVTLNQSCINADETSWRTKGKRKWLWIATTKGSAYYKIDGSRSGEAFSRIIGEKFKGTLTTDRYGAYNNHIGKRQLCLGHIGRDIEKIIDRKNIDSEIGKGLKETFSELFRLWNGFKSGDLTRRELIEGTEAFCKKRAWALLRLGAMGKGLRSKTRGTCKNLLKSFDGLWVYLYEEGVEPTNNLAEQDVRQGVIWRKISSGTQSEAGERFVERILTVGMTLKKQSKSVLGFLVESFQSYIRAGPMPMPI